MKVGEGGAWSIPVRVAGGIYLGNPEARCNNSAENIELDDKKKGTRIGLLGGPLVRGEKPLQVEWPGK